MDGEARRIALMPDNSGWVRRAWDSIYCCQVSGRQEPLSQTPLTAAGTVESLPGSASICLACWLYGAAVSVLLLVFFHVCFAQFSQYLKAWPPPVTATSQPNALVRKCDVLILSVFPFLISMNTGLSSIPTRGHPRIDVQKPQLPSAALSLLEHTTSVSDNFTFLKLFPPFFENIPLPSKTRVGLVSFFPRVVSTFLASFALLAT